MRSTHHAEWLRETFAVGDPASVHGILAMIEAVDTTSRTNAANPQPSRARSRSAYCTSKR
jgi:hypothetical protein